MALKELERLTQELDKLSQLLKSETRSRARLVIIRRFQEIIDRIGEGI